jgi:hypothetical protein
MREESPREEYFKEAILRLERNVLIILVEKTRMERKHFLLRRIKNKI